MSRLSMAKPPAQGKRLPAPEAVLPQAELEQLLRRFLVGKTEVLESDVLSELAKVI